MLSIKTLNIWFSPNSFVLSVAVAQLCTYSIFSAFSPSIKRLASIAAPNDVFPLPLLANSAA